MELKAVYRSLVKRSRKNLQRGQILLVIILFMVVILTIGLSLAARNITNISESTADENSQRAFSAAEAGIQVALEANQNISETNIDPQTTYKAEIQVIRDTEIALNNGMAIRKNNPADVWLSNYPGYQDKWSGELTVYWGNAASTDPCSEAALEIAVVSGTDMASPIMRQSAYDPCESRRSTNNFTAPEMASGSYTIDEKEYKYRAILAPSISNGIIARIIPLYANALLGVSGDSALPVQGRVIESIGSAGDTQRKIVVVQEHPKLPPEMFPYVLFTPQQL
jgi:Tfp pilus assembly protein PilX